MADVAEPEAVSSAHPRFDNADQLSAFVRDSSAGATLVPSGPRPLPRHSAVPAENVIFVDTRGMQSIVEYTISDQVVSVDCGITCGELQARLSENRHWLPISASCDQTLLEVITGGDAGELEHGFGGPRDLVLGLSVLLADGRTIRTGGKVVKNVTGYDTTKLFVGSHGWLGIPLVAHLRLYALPESERTLLFGCSDVAAAFAAAHAVLKLGLPISSCEIFSAARLVQKMTLPAVPEFTCYFAVQIHGHHQVVAEVAEAVIAAAGQSGRAQPAFVENDLSAMWMQSNNAAAADEAQACIQLTLTGAGMLKVLQDANSTLGVWQARPWRGGLRIFVAPAAVSSAVESVRSAVAAWKMIASLAYPSDEYWFCVDRVGGRDGAAEHLKGELKKRFDPQNKMNRLVQL